MAEKEKIVPAPIKDIVATPEVSAEMKKNVKNNAKNFLEQAENRLKQIRESLWMNTDRYDGRMLGDDKNGSKLDNAYGEIERRIQANSSEFNSKSIVADLTKLVTDAFEAERKMIEAERKKKWLSPWANDGNTLDLNKHERDLTSQLKRLSGGAMPLVQSNGKPAEALKDYGSNGDGLDISRLADGESHFSKTAGKSLEFGMQSGLVMAAPAASKVLRKNVLPFAPAVMMGGMAVRGVTTAVSKEMTTGDKALDMTKMAGEVVLYATPIVGTGMTARDAYKAYQEGKTADAVALSIGTVVSAVFDGVTLVAIATGIGAPGAVGLTAVRVGIKEAVVAWTKQGAGFFARNASKIIAGSKAIVTEGASFVAKNSKVVWEWVKAGPAKFVAETVKDTGRNLKDLMTMKSARDWVKHRKENPTKAMQARQELEKATVRAKVENGEDPNAAHIDTFKRLETEISSRSLSDLHTKLEEVSYDTRNEKSVREGLASLSAKDQYVLNGLNAQKSIGVAVDKMEALFKDASNKPTVKALGDAYTEIWKQIQASIDSKSLISPNLQERLARMKAGIDSAILELPKKPTELAKNPFAIDAKAGPTEAQMVLMDFSNGLKGTDKAAKRFDVNDEDLLTMTGQNAPRPGYEADTQRTIDSMLGLLRNEKLDPGNRVIIFRSYLDRLSARGHASLESVHKELLMNASISLSARRDFFLEYVRVAREGELGLRPDLAVETLSTLTKDSWSSSKAAATLDFVSDLRLSDPEMFTRFSKQLPDQAFDAFDALLKDVAKPQYSKGKMSDLGMKMSRIRVIEEAFANNGMKMGEISQANMEQRTGQLLRDSYQKTVIENRTKLSVIREMVLSGDPKANAVLIQAAVGKTDLADKSLYALGKDGKAVLKVPSEIEIAAFIQAYPDPAIVLKLLRTAPEWKSSGVTSVDHVATVLAESLGFGSKFSVPERMKILQELESIGHIPDSVKWFSRLSLGEQLRTMSDYEFALHQPDIKRYVDRFKSTGGGTSSNKWLFSDVRADYDERMASLSKNKDSMPSKIREEMIVTAWAHLESFLKGDLCKYTIDGNRQIKFAVTDAEFAARLEYEFFPKLRQDGHANADLLIGIRHQISALDGKSPILPRLRELEKRVQKHMDTKQVFHFDMDGYVKLAEKGEAGKVLRAKMLAEYIAKNNITSTKEIARAISHFAEIQSSRQNITRGSGMDGKMPASEMTGTRKAFLDIAIGNSKSATEQSMRNGEAMPLDEVAKFFAGKSMDFRISLLEELEAAKCFSFKEPYDRVLAIEMLESANSTDFRNNVHRLSEYLKKHKLDPPAMNTRFLFHEFAQAKDSATAESYMEMLRSQKEFVHPRYLPEVLSGNTMHAPVVALHSEAEVRSMLRELVLLPDGGSFKTPLSMQKRVLLASHEYLQNDPQVLEFLRKSLKSDERSAALYVLSKRGDMAALERTKWYGDVEFSGNGNIRFSKIKDPQLVAYGLRLKSQRDSAAGNKNMTKEELDFLTAYESLPRLKDGTRNKRIGKATNDAFTDESVEKLHSLFVYAHLGESARGSLLYEKLRGIATMVSGAISQSTASQAVEEGQKVASATKMWDTSRMAQAGTHGQEILDPHGNISHIGEASDFGMLSSERIAKVGHLSDHQKFADRWRVIGATAELGKDETEEQKTSRNAMKAGESSAQTETSHLSSHKRFADRANAARWVSGEWRTEAEAKNFLTTKAFKRTVGLALFFWVMSKAQAGVLGQQVNEAAKKGAEAKLATNPEYQKATAERKKQIQEETIQEMTRLEMDRIKNDLQRKIDKKIQGVVDTVLVKALPDTDKRIPEIKRQFLAEMYKFMNESEDSSAFYNLYDSASGNGLGASIETIINTTITADQTLTRSDISMVIRTLSPRLTPPLNEMEIGRITNAIYGGLMAIR